MLGDTRIDQVSHTALPHDELLDWLDGLRSRRKVLILATCHSGQGKSLLSGRLAEELASTKGLAIPPLREVSEAIILIGVCAWNETARESAELGHDIYTWYFLEGLAQADLDGDGAVTVTEAHDHARRHTYAHTGGAQRPYARLEMLGDDPIVLTGKRLRPGLASAGSFRSVYDGLRVYVDGVDKGVLPGIVLVEPGVRRVELVSTEQRVLARRQVRFEHGGRVELDTLVRPHRLRLGGGGGVLGLGAPGAGGAALSGELHLPRLLPTGWEVVAHGASVLRWPRPSVAFGIAVERILVPGSLQLRGGLGLEGFLLGAPGTPPLLAPSLVPLPVVSVAWLPQSPAFARLWASGGYLWYADQGDWHHGWTAQGGLAVGLAPPSRGPGN